MKNFQIGDDIYSLLTHDEAVAWYVGDSIFPLVAPAETSYPFIVYRRGGYAADGDNKDNLAGEQCTIDLAIVDPSYSKSVQIANAVADALQGARTDRIYRMWMTGASEDFTDDAMVQRLTFTCILTE